MAHSNESGTTQYEALPNGWGTGFALPLGFSYFYYAGPRSSEALANERHYRFLQSF